jgi:EAL domain-containing protein (putative c-di-GMP-specific phosphodiesterase class I)
MEHAILQNITRRGTEATSEVWFLAGHLDPCGETSYIPINESPFLIGRRPDLSLCLPSRTVSSLHAEIRLESGRLVLQDKTSTNGTYLNGQRIGGEVELRSEDLIQIADIPFRVCRQILDAPTQTVAENVYDQAMALVQFDKLMSERQVTPFYQPVVDFADNHTVGYEVLARSRLFGLTTPDAMFKAAQKLNLEVQLSRMLRWEGIRCGHFFPTPPHLFVNTHPKEMAEPGLVDSMRAVREAHPGQPLTLEIHEASVTNERMMTELRAGLHDLNVSLAYDDFGSGRARLTELAKVRPEYLKFDRSLIHGIDSSSAKHQQMISTLVEMVRDLDVVALAEGVETAEEADTCRQLGFQLVQGFYFGRPAPATCGPTGVPRREFAASGPVDLG